MYEVGEPWLPDAQLQRRVITEAKRTDERAFLAEVPSVVLVRALNDLNSAYRNYFASATGRRKGPKVGEPRFRSREEARQTIRFTRNGFSLRDGGLYLAKIGEVNVHWSRHLPSEPSSVTVIKDAAGRYFASFLVRTNPADDLLRFPETDTEVGIDLGLASFAVLSDGTTVDNPRILRRAEKRLKKLQQALSRKQQGSNNRAKARLKVARAHAKIADARRDFHHKLSTTIVREKSGLRGRPCGERALSYPPGQVSSRRRPVQLCEHVRVQGRAVGRVSGRSTGGPRHRKCAQPAACPMDGNRCRCARGPAAAVGQSTTVT